MKIESLKPQFIMGLLVGLLAMLLLLASLPATVQFASSESSNAHGPSIQSGTYQITLRGFVPTICRVSVEPKVTPAGGVLVDLGEMKEFCNSPNGYIVYADHTPNVTGAVLIIDGRSVVLSPHGSTMLLESRGPGNRTHKVSLDLRNHPAPKGYISFRIQPL
ncbi:hypothetical protein ACQKOE_02420 [Novosphingobium sp. NPDC080210]|uniref:hypothetical protein n=1 Tax=Novosphingobium sp. NPDC080210 TaxID=3390596 RepID=UPI003D02F26D